MLPTQEVLDVWLWIYHKQKLVTKYTWKCLFLPKFIISMTLLLLLTFTAKCAFHLRGLRRLIVKSLLTKDVLYNRYGIILFFCNYNFLIILLKCENYIEIKYIKISILQSALICEIYLRNLIIFIELCFVCRYVKQNELMNKVCTELEAETETDSEEVKKSRFDTVLTLMQQVRYYLFFNIFTMYVAILFALERNVLKVANKLPSHFFSAAVDR